MKSRKGILADTNLDWLHSDLNNAQQAAVAKTDGPVLILAGAGSGKTRVLTYRIAYLLCTGLAEPKEIIAMTFTNKAAGEMRERIKRLAGDMISGMWIGTFHSLFARILRREADRIGYTSSFAIYDTGDQETLIKTILNEKNISAQEFPPKKVAYVISNAKNRFIVPKQFANDANTRHEQVIADLYQTYQSRLREHNALDFDDLLIKPAELFELFPLVKEFYQDRFRYILVDEYQDTNHAQHVVLKILSKKHKNICVVGDDDQSIYSWRGAEIKNILEFETEFPKCSKFRLEQNYRSTRNILAAAHSVVKNNHQRLSKQLWTEKPDGELVTVLEVGDDLDEARTIVNKIAFELRAGEKSFHDFAVLYRTNAQSRVLEDALRRENIPYIIVGGVKFYERKEVKDVLAYLRILCNPADTINLRRIINYPPRGIGEATIGRLEAYAREHEMTVFNTMSQADKIPNIAKNTANKILEFYEFLKKCTSLVHELSAAELAASLVDELGIWRQYKEEGTIESLTRAENVRELLSAIAEFSNSMGPETTLEQYLENVALTLDIDTWDDRTNAATLMTLHSAKGLEFKVVFITGLEEGLMPISRNLDDPKALEEERRLFYVGATRAQEKLYVSWARNRRKFNEFSRCVASRFIKELDRTFINIENTYAYKSRKRQRTVDTYQSDPMPNYEDESQENQEFRVGMRVLHPTFGKGTILKLEPSRADNIKLRIIFDTQGERRLVLPYAKLEIL